ncbi:putative ribonuclease H-like domain-containing protein [Tanacetum coccineum]
MQENEKDLQDELEMMVTQELAAKAMDDVSEDKAFEEKMRRNCISKEGSSSYQSNTPNVSAASTSMVANAVLNSYICFLGGKILAASTLLNADLPIDPNMLALEDASNTLPNDGIFNGAYDDDDVGAEANFNNMDNTIAASPILTLRIHKDHLKGQILGDPKSAFKLQKVWVLVDLPYGKKVIGTKWVFRNKRDERSIVVKNKAWLVAQGFREKEGIYYDEVFAPVARIEAIRLFLAFASYMGFTVYQMDVKSAFLYGTIEEEVYVHQPLGFVDPAHPNKVYKVIKALYGLHQAPNEAWYEDLSSFYWKNWFRKRPSVQSDVNVLGRRLILLQCKKQSIMANYYTTEAEYVAAANVVESNQFGKLPRQNHLLMVGTHTIIDIIDSTEYTITEASVRSKLQLADATGIHNLSDAEIYDGLAILGYVGKLQAMVPGSYEAPILEGNTSGSAEDSMQLKELMGEEPEDQGRIIQDIDDDPLVSLVRESMKMKEEKSIDFWARRYRRQSLRSWPKNINTGLDAEEEINTGREEINIGIEEVSTGSTKVDSGTASKRGQREGKAPMVEEDSGLLTK